jgi:HD superfamily phosphohydrolase
MAMKPTRDIVHDYIYLTPIENLLIDSPVFQRLRFILQNSSAYLTYPSNSTNRFSHSIGVMHLGGRMFTKALENAERKTAEKFLDECHQLILSKKAEPRGYPFYVKLWKDTLGNACGFNHKSLSDFEDQGQ